MEIVHFKSDRANFGDDLNLWLWPRLFPEIEFNSMGVSFFGIGTTLFNNNPFLMERFNNRKIVFGTGIRPDFDKFLIDDSWDIKFLRGPYSAYSLGNKYPFISDAAYAMRSINEFSLIQTVKKKYKISFMPYFRSVELANWKLICKQLGYHYISPLNEQGIEFTLSEIAASEQLITEAMHGAIIADLLRVPWSRIVFSTPYTEGLNVSEFKWYDWLISVQLYHIETTKIMLYKKNRYTELIRKVTSNRLNIEYNLKCQLSDTIFNGLSSIKKFNLSEDSTIAILDEKFNREIQLLTKSY